MVKAMQFIV